MKLLLFADLHSFDEEDLNKIDQDFDYIFFLGDIGATTMKTILNVKFSKTPTKRTKYSFF